MPDHAQFIESYKQQFNENGIKRLMGRDIQKFSKLMSTPEDLKVQTQVIIAYVKDSQWRRMDNRSIECNTFNKRSHQCSM